MENIKEFLKEDIRQCKIRLLELDDNLKSKKDLEEELYFIISQENPFKNGSLRQSIMAGKKKELEKQLEEGIFKENKKEEYFKCLHHIL